MQIDIYTKKSRLRLFQEGGTMETTCDGPYTRTHAGGMTVWNAVPHEYMTGTELRSVLEEAKRAIDARLANIGPNT